MEQPMAAKPEKPSIEQKTLDWFIELVKTGETDKTKDRDFLQRLAELEIHLMLHNKNISIR